MSLVLVPLLAITTIALGSAPGNPAWLRYAGYAILAALAPFALILIAQAFTGRVRITPEVLSVSSLGRRVDLRRDQILEINPRTVTSGITGQPALHFDVVYSRPGQTGRKAKGAFFWLDTQCTVDSTDLIAAHTSGTMATPRAPP